MGKVLIIDLIRRRGALSADPLGPQPTVAQSTWRGHEHSRDDAEEFREQLRLSGRLWWYSRLWFATVGWVS